MTRRDLKQRELVAAGDDGATLTRSLQTLRRRRTRVLGVRYLPTAVGIGIVATQVSSLVTGTGTRGALLWLAGAMAAAAIASFAAAVVRTPSLGQTARLVDRRAALQNRAATALQFAGQDDVISRLVLSDASRRISSLDPAAVFPREYPSRPRALVAFVAASTLLFSVATARAPRSLPSETASGSGGANAGVAAQSSRAAARGQRPPGPPAGAQQGESPVTAAARSAPTASNALVASERKEGSTTPGELPAPAQDRREAPIQRAAAESPGERGAEKAARQRDDESAGAGGAGAARATRAASRPADAGGGEGAGAVSRSVRAGGGVGGSELADPDAGRDVPRQAAPGTREYVRAHQAAWRRAQAAMAQDRVPPELREYVRRYFAAIRAPR